jgi:hypothetical protein
MLKAPAYIYMRQGNSALARISPLPTESRCRERYFLRMKKPLTLPSEREPAMFPVPRPTTGSVDDEDEPEDERDDENEAPVRETSDITEAPEEFNRDDEDRIDE